MILRRVASWRERRPHRERGAVMVEFVLAVPIVIMMIFAIVEFSLIWRNSLTTGSAAQLGARAAANSGDHRLADFRAVAGAQSGLDGLPADAEIERVVVFKPINDSGDIDPDCLTLLTSKAGVCNVYVGAILDDPVVVADFDPANTGFCDVAEPDSSWCPTARLNSFASGFDTVGVYVAVRHSHLTGVLFGNSTRLLTDTTVMQLEPEVN